MRRSIWLALWLVPFAASAAEMYRWVDANGITHYSDSPPPVSVQQASRLTAATEQATAATAQAKPAVVLYAFACGPLCDNAMAWLAERNIGYSLKNPQTEPEAATELQKLTGVQEVPVLKVGDKHHKGFEPANWTKLLTGAGYSAASTKPEKK